MAQFRFNTISLIDIENSPGGAVMIYAINYEDPPNLFITGVPGSGKTTVNLMRAERLVKLGRKVAFFTYQRLLVVSLQNSATTELAPHIHTFLQWFSNHTHGTWATKVTEAEMISLLAGLRRCFDEVIIDEGQDLELKFIRSILTLGKKITASADDAQRINLSGATSAQIKSALEDIGPVTSIPLEYNYRNTYEIYNFARFFLHQSTRANSARTLARLTPGGGAVPNVFQAMTEADRKERLRILLTNAGERNIAVLVFSHSDVDHYHKMITDLGFKCSKHRSGDWVEDDIENILVTTLMSAKGVEFQVVILPNFEAARTDYPKHYYVGCTRPRETLSIIALRTLPTFLSDFDRNTYNLIP